MLSKSPLAHSRLSAASSSTPDLSTSLYSYRMSDLPSRIPADVFAPAKSFRTSVKDTALLSNIGGLPLALNVPRRAVADAVSIPHLREAIHSLDSKVASLMIQREELELHLEQAVRLQSPVLRLPSELLATIFIMGVLGIEDEYPVMVSTLMLVCRYWADVAIHTPALWSKIFVSTHDSLEKARRKLARSKSVPLDVTINFSPRVEHSGGVTESVIKAMDLIRPALWRTRSFRLSVPNRPQAHAALLRCQEEAPLLEVLSIRIFHSMQEDHYSSPALPLFNGCTPRLRSCSFTSFNFGWDARVVSQLCVLKLGGYWNGFSPSVTTLLDILRGCPQLEELALRNMSDIDPDSCSTPDQEKTCAKTVHLPRLIKASFNYAGISRTRMILSQISFPALETLEFCYLDNLTPLLELLRNEQLPSLPLRYLRIESSFFNELKFVKLLPRLPSLETLELVDVEDISSIFLKSLSTPAASQPWICPTLETLNIDGCTNLEWDALRTFVESRLSSSPHCYSRQQLTFPSTNLRPATLESASAATLVHARSLVPYSLSSNVTPFRLRSIDVTRCHQISRECIQWLRMYVSHVKCEPAKGVWGEPVMP